MWIGHVATLQTAYTVWLFRESSSIDASGSARRPCRFSSYILPVTLPKELWMKRFFLFVLAMIAVVPALAQQPQKPAPKTVYIRAGRLFDGTGDKVRENMVIVVVGDRIQSVVPASATSIPADATVLDLSRATVLPGLIDCHTHLGARADRYDEIYNFKDTPFHSAFAGVVNAHKTLDAGFTTVRDVGSPPFLAVDLRNSINEGFIPGPRHLASGH